MRVDAQRNARLFAHIDGNTVKFVQFGNAFDIDLGNIGLKGFAHFGIGLANPGKDDLGRFHARTKRTAHFTNRNHVCTRTKIGKCFQDCLVGVCLNGKAHGGIKAVKRVGIDFVMAFQGRGRIAKERGSDLVSHFPDRDAFGVQFAVDIFKMVHWAG